MRQYPQNQQQPQPPQPQPPQPPQPQPLPQPLHPLQPPQPLWQPPQPQRASWGPYRGVPAVSLSKTKNVPKLTSAISSSLSVICGGAPSRGGVSEVATAAVACVPPTSDKAPTTPTTGTACFRCFRFDVLLLFRIEASHALNRDSDARSVTRTPCIATVQEWSHEATQCCTAPMQRRVDNSTGRMQFQLTPINVYPRSVRPGSEATQGLHRFIHRNLRQAYNQGRTYIRSE